MTSRRDIRAVLFDLDGTLLDTAPDMAGALNALLAEHGRAPLPYDAIRPFVSHGSSGMIQTGFGAVDEAPRADLIARFLALYEERVCHQTRWFDGMERVIDAIEGHDMAWGIVTNKPGYLTAPLMTHFGLDTRAACIVAGDTLPERKPHPLPLLHACRALALTPAECVYVGDAERDIQAARAAGMTPIIAAWGYIDHLERPADWAAEATLDEPVALHRWLLAGHDG